MMFVRDHYIMNYTINVPLPLSMINIVFIAYDCTYEYVPPAAENPGKHISYKYFLHQKQINIFLYYAGQLMYA